MIILIFLLQRYSQNVMHTVMIWICFLFRFYYGLCNTQYWFSKIRRLHRIVSFILHINYLHYFPPYTSSLSPQHHTHFFPSLFTVMTSFHMCQVYMYSWQKTTGMFISSSKSLRRPRRKLTLVFGKSISREEKQQAKEKCRLFVYQIFLSLPPVKLILSMTKLCKTMLSR